MTRLLKEESGYSLAEVIVSIFILTAAIIPMVGMFDMGLNAATEGSNYDKARALAKKQLEQAQSLPYTTVRTSLPNAPCTFDASGRCEAVNLEVPTAEDPNGEFDNFRYAIVKQYVAPSDITLDDEAADDTGMMRITVDVGWGGDLVWPYTDPGYTSTTTKAR
ncbi:MAG: hypothetical protein AVDCRST_MAG93-958 [uncultured Chloroflexia bacterium]|uniref:Uncharacterized protein n=1 Tax=uncultured Chloroflexia bacterium TaxID=1672391 RepID=A0A6J4HSF7_9CHLR|nr:MAG: hypothetical protein AVDCRST_MAG93-958 [uncultured Chloroflexia bacterium]